MPSISKSILNMDSNKITSLGDATAATDAANLGQINATLDLRTSKRPVSVATTANITLSAPQTIDGVAVIANERVLVKNQTTASANGIYVVNAGAWTRDTDFDTNTEAELGCLVYITKGTVHGGQYWKLDTKAAIVLGTTALSFSQVFAGSGAPAGTNYNIQYYNGGVFGADANINVVPGSQPKLGIGLTTITAALHIKSWDNIGSPISRFWTSTGDNVLETRSDGYVKLGNQEVLPRIYATATAGGSVTYSAGGLSLEGFIDSASSTTDAIGLVWTVGSVLSGTYNGVVVKGVGAFNPTSGTALMNTMLVSPVVNQTGGASGITRGIFINPTLTAAADWRSLEISNNSGKAIWQTGASAINTLAGNTGFGGQLSPSYAIDAGTSTGGIRIPNGTTAQQPAHAAGVIRFNSTTGFYEGSNGSSWLSLGGGGLSGGTANYVAYWTSGSALGASSNLQFNGTDMGVGGGVVAGFRQYVNGSIRVDGTLVSRGSGSSFATTLGSAHVRLWNTTAVTGDTWYLGSADDGGLGVVSGNLSEVARFLPTTGMMRLSYSLALPGNAVPSALAANTNNLDLGDAGSGAVARISSSANVNLTGIAGGVAGRVLIVYNTGSFNITFTHDSASSTAANRFLIDGGNNFVLYPNAGLIMIYDSTSARWRSAGMSTTSRTCIINDYTTSQTDTSVTVPQGAKIMECLLVGGGGGGGGGYRGAAGTNRYGGGGGGGAGASLKKMSLTSLGNPTTITVTVGAGGAGGASATTNTTNGGNGGIGGESNVKLSAAYLAMAGGGEGGNGGTTSGVSAPGGGGGASSGTTVIRAGELNGLIGGFGQNGTGSDPSGRSTFEYAPGGGGGGGISTSNVSGGGGKSCIGCGGYATFIAGVGVDTNGTTAVLPFSEAWCGNGGGGGGAYSTTAAGNGGAGIRGSGGGGGGASLNGFNSGAGGAGGAGFVRIIFYF